MNKKLFILILLLISLLMINCKSSQVCGTLKRITLNVNYDTVPYGIISNSNLNPGELVIPDSTFYISLIINDTVVKEYKVNDKVYYSLSRKDLKNKYCLKENDILN
jgi:hypothetical protein